MTLFNLFIWVLLSTVAGFTLGVVVTLTLVNKAIVRGLEAMHVRWAVGSPSWRQLEDAFTKAITYN